MADLEQAGPSRDEAAQTGDAQQPVRVCAHCGKALPAPKAGRPRKYCDDTCKEAARRERVPLDSQIAEPLSELRDLAETLSPLTTPVLTALTRIHDALAAAEEGALGLVATAQADAAQARREADEDRARAGLAEAREAAAQRQAAADGKARADAERAAEAARQDADRREHEAADQVAGSERLRGQAEGARAGAERARDELAARVRAVQEELTTVRTAMQARLDRARTDNDDLAGALTRTEAARAAAREEALTAQAEARDARARAETAEREAVRARQEAEDQVQQARQAASHAERQRAAAEERAEQSRRERDEARAELRAVQAGARATEEMLERERDAARRDAGAQRERAVIAETRLAAAVAARNAPEPGAETVPPQ
ncbi:hypothetical protein ACRYCC_16915 [Actinomadura scrupuli]|uniref:hypothetical protein n=1 Tax=Actinomadura scrupuli TaxID=559629 RepID=UPI003D96E1FF